MINSIGNSGGRTSAHMSFLFRTGKVDVKYSGGHDCEYVFCDTGGEAQETYDFLRQCNAAFDLNVVCLGAVINDSMGKGNDYEVVDINSLTFNLDKMKAITKKYGGFTNNRPHCTDKLKTIIVEKYRKSNHGKSGYQTWIGIRYDEPKRLIGCHKHLEKSAYKQLLAQGLEKDDISELFCALSEDLSLLDSEYEYLKPETKELIRKRIHKQKSLGLRYLAQISKIDKQGVLDWWANQSFDLQIEEHEGNCLFCVKKSDLKITLASRDKPEEFKQWCEMVSSKDVRIMPADKFGRGHIYRRWLTPELMIAQFSDSTTEELRQRVYKTKQFDTGSCSESCEAFGELD
jgi:hypothetical protein